jgi:hypothetical protein
MLRRSIEAEIALAKLNGTVLRLEKIIQRINRLIHPKS